MSDYEKQRLSEIVKGMENEEYDVVLHSIPSAVLFDELKRRDSIKDDMLNGVIKAINGED